MIVAYLVGDIPTAQAALFVNESDLYPVLVETPRTIRPGDDFMLTVRGAEYRSFIDPTVISFTFSTEELSFVRNISPTTIHVLAVGNRWLLEPIECEISTVRLDTPPASFFLEITETLFFTPDTKISDSGFTEIRVDRTPIPPAKVTQGVVSLLGFLIGVFGVAAIGKS